MEWKKYDLDLMLVPLGVVITIAYHVWLWHKVRTSPFSTTIGINAHGRRFWVPAMMKDIEKNTILVVQTLRNLIMGSTLMATTSILLSAGLAAVISSTYSIKKPLNDAVFGAHGEFMLSLKFLNQVCILVATPQDLKSIITPQYLTELLEKGTILNTVGNRLFYAALPLLLWIFGPVLVFLCSMAMIPVLYNLDFVCGSDGRGKVDFNGTRDVNDYVL
ncbi:uncharacterized protein LOC129292282 isoform X2 [Prosopis cineraria]|uniref:uncharacterized protein LOC129292282 isoform X2 n=1 Tax=Prosopis cineraria TaxID=364024 RepID=UPI0024103A79|nr:uncharacterized protein LOC129292282 isoform X2 [Prosopis cineraria]